MLRWPPAFAGGERSLIDRPRATLNRCRIVGTAVSGVIDGCLAARGLSNSYDRAGKHTRY